MRSRRPDDPAWGEQAPTAEPSASGLTREGRPGDSATREGRTRDWATREAARLEAVVRGRVQGVGFRYFVLSQARRLRLGGWVRNETDGKVRCIAEGPREDLELFLETLYEGPAGALVDGVAVLWGPAAGAPSPFEIRSRAHPGD